MPPAGLPRPDKSASDSLASWLENEIDQAAAAHPNPGRKAPFHRLNRAEYQNVIRDLLSVEIDVAALLPPDDAGYGFDNIAGVLKINQPLMERYLSAARRISRVALGSRQTPATSVTVRLRPDLPQYDQIEQLGFGTRGGTLFRHTFPVDAEYVIKLQLGAGTAAGPRQLELNIDGERVKLFPLSPPSRGRGQPPPQDPDDVPAAGGGLEARIPIQAGPREIGVTFVKGAANVEIEGARAIFRRPGPFHEGNSFMPVAEPFLGSVTITGPFNIRGPGDTPSRRRILVCQPASRAEEARCARTILTELARRAYRRPVSDADVTPLLAFFNDNRAAAGSKRASRSRCGGCSSPRNSCSASNRPRGISPRAAIIASPIWSWRRASRSSCGAASPMTNCWTWRPGDSSGTRRCSSSRSAVSWPIRVLSLS